MQLLRRLSVPLICVGFAATTSCGGGAENEDPLIKGDGCTLRPVEGDRVCGAGLVCDPVASSDGYVCATPVELHGQVIDALSTAPLEGALVTALDETGAPVSDVAVTDLDGNYVLVVAAARTEDGELAGDSIYTLQAFGYDYQPFPYGVRPALPISTTDLVTDDASGTLIIDNPTTTVGLLPLPAGERGGATITGQVGGELPGGTLVVAEDLPGTTRYGVADLSGSYTIFNVTPGNGVVKGYRRGLELETASVTVAAADLAEVNLAAVAEGDSVTGQVSGQVSIVNAPGDAVTSVVLVPTSVFNDVFELGPVPFGLRDPDPGNAVSVSGAFNFEGVPSGTYKVLAAFENDDLVRDPDVTIGGTTIQEVTLAPGDRVSAEEGFKVTEALEIVSPGAEGPEPVSGTPTFVFADDSSEDFYELQVYDALGTKVWEDLMVPSVSGSKTVEVVYDGPGLTTGMYYQFRASSMRDKQGGITPISRTEDLRGVFVAQ
ncbi:MAG: hypothetical protein ACPG4T_06665 [Nannocystaceae bacterium]